eukprot:CAMPEP_0201571346 /NCGR_PEP_ID=MMETSP0190_2-20130828/14076_1 /ASSEMBLY_ACC=CAM_ASM_000263 /TAXON_ID=37353 /ORGANISM="Rosalina sp." /LENGTH=92 /DNA_ID=CAMNT_0047995899 /DNA_START=500 /DNA_END=778 /DNA_ORIENTATION=-
MDIDNDKENENDTASNEHNKNKSNKKEDADNDGDDDPKDVFVELSNEKGERIRWKSQPMIDFNKLDISPNCNFDGRHLSALYCRAFSQIATE